MAYPIPLNPMVSNIVQLNPGHQWLVPVDIEQKNTPNVSFFRAIKWTELMINHPKIIMDGWYKPSPNDSYFLLGLPHYIVLILTAYL